MRTKRSAVIEDIFHEYLKLHNLLAYVETSELPFITCAKEFREVQDFLAFDKMKLLLKKLKDLVVIAKSRRYDKIAPHYEQLCIKAEEPTSNDPA